MSVPALPEQWMSTEAVMAALRELRAVYQDFNNATRYHLDTG